MNTSGSGAVRWPWFEAFDNLFRKDVTIHPTNIVESGSRDGGVRRRRRQEEGEEDEKGPRRRRRRDDHFNEDYIELQRQSEANRERARKEAQDHRREVEATRKDQAERTIEMYAAMVKTHQEMVKVLLDNQK